MKNLLQIKLKSIHKNTLKLYITFFIQLLKKQNIKYQIVYLPKRIKKITLLKSPHVYKKAREQFQLTKYNILIQINENINSKLLRLLIINKPTTILFRIKKI